MARLRCTEGFNTVLGAKLPPCLPEDLGQAAQGWGPCSRRFQANVIRSRSGSPLGEDWPQRALRWLEGREHSFLGLVLRAPAPGPLCRWVHRGAEGMGTESRGRRRLSEAQPPGAPCLLRAHREQPREACSCGRKLEWAGDLGESFYYRGAHLESRQGKDPGKDPCSSPPPTPRPSPIYA